MNALSFMAQSFHDHVARVEAQPDKFKEQVMDTWDPEAKRFRSMLVRWDGEKYVEVAK